MKFVWGASDYIRSSVLYKLVYLSTILIKAGFVNHTKRKKKRKEKTGSWGKHTIFVSTIVTNSKEVVLMVSSIRQAIFQQIKKGRKTLNKLAMHAWGVLLQHKSYEKMCF